MSFVRVYYADEAANQFDRYDDLVQEATGQRIYGTSDVSDGRIVDLRFNTLAEARQAAGKLYEVVTLTPLRGVLGIEVYGDNVARGPVQSVPFGRAAAERYGR